MADFEEMRNAVTRAVMHTVQCRWCIPGYGVYCSEHARIANEEEVERLRLENLELRSEVQRLTQQAHYAG